ncbi:alpha/beta fold hydrolase [Cellulomonas sp. NPDC058312]|uniref:alpha/beta fold hydrolase n=1 Tax=Cellulomonas sp. NPDC058312 TaxID=3346441 RepID=UPI0036EED34A
MAGSSISAGVVVADPWPIAPTTTWERTTAHLVDDIECLREHLGIERWIVAGESWGVSLGLVYAQKYPERVIAAVFGAITAGTRTEIDWITRAMGRVFPQPWGTVRRGAAGVRSEDPADYAPYLEAMGHGMPPHGGFAIACNGGFRDYSKPTTSDTPPSSPRDTHRVRP